jgi:porphobilinogen synthase
MGYPEVRMRRLRLNPQIRNLVRETQVDTSDLIAPLFIVPGKGIKKEISSLANQYHLSVDQCIESAQRIRDLGIPSVLLFGIPEHKDARGSSACEAHGVIQRASEAIKREVPGLLVISDLCYCEYTDHGHCGIVTNGDLDNDATITVLQEQALSHARAGVDVIAPSGMIDGMVRGLRSALDGAAFDNIPIMSYSAKFASSFYGPFREAVDSTPTFGDRRTYQMDPANRRQALREVALDVEEGADILMVKPALAFLDIIREVRDKFDLPLAAYNVSGEYAMVKAAAAKGWIDGRRVMLESLLSIKRAGADMIITYFAEEFAELARRGETDI